MWVWNFESVEAGYRWGSACGAGFAEPSAELQGMDGKLRGKRDALTFRSQMPWKSLEGVTAPANHTIELLGLTATWKSATTWCSGCW